MGRPLADFATRLLSPVVERKAGMTLDLLASWESLAGPDHAAHTRPERLKWPRADAEEFRPATLVVACEGAHAVFFQHEASRLVERVNAFFGFAAVERVQIVQKPLPERTERPAPAAPQLDAREERSLRRDLTRVSDDGLRDALARLGRGVRSEKRR